MRAKNQHIRLPKNSAKMVHSVTVSPEGPWLVPARVKSNWRYSLLPGRLAVFGGRSVGGAATGRASTRQ